MSERPIVLVILDGYGLNNDYDHNVVYEGETPVVDQLISRCPFVKGETNGIAVRLPEEQMGNSEVRHFNMGTGRIVCQELTRITKPIQDDDFSQAPEFLAAVENCKKNDSVFHMFGLVSDGRAYSHNTHIYGLLDLAKGNGPEKVYAHCFLGGCDTPLESDKGYAATLEAKMKEIGMGEVASVMGRCYAMDRDKRWDHVELAYNALTKGRGNTVSNTTEGVQVSYDAGEADKFAVPFVVEKDRKSVAMIGSGDSVIFYNFHLDHAREITCAFCDNDFDGFARDKKPDLMFVCFIDYDGAIKNRLVVFKEEGIINTFGEFLAARGKAQVRIVETEEYAHVTSSFNGGVEEPNLGEDHILVLPPKKVAAYDLESEMSALDVCDKLMEVIKSGKYDVITINFVSPGMVGHTDVEEAAIKATETADVYVGRVVEAIKEVGDVIFVCVDYGSAEQPADYGTGEPFTAHTTNPIPFILVNVDPSYELYEGGALCDVILTLIQLMGMEQPGETTGTSLLVKQPRNLLLSNMKRKASRK